MDASGVESARNRIINMSVTVITLNINIKIGEKINR